MQPRLKKLIGSVGVMAFLAGYVWLMTLIADHVPEQPLAQMLFFLVAGVSWGAPIIPLIRWMNSPPRSARST